MRLRIEKLVAGGLGLARTQRGAALIAGALPGELVEAELRPRKNHLEGHVTAILEPHPGRYGGYLPPSASLPLVYTEQLPLKQALVEEALARVGKLEGRLAPIQPSPSTGSMVEGFGYRTAAQYALNPTGGLAYRAPRSSQLIKVGRDPLIAEPLQAAFRLLTHWPLSSFEEVVLRGSLYQNAVQVGFIGGQPRFFQQTAQALVQEGIAGVVWAEPHPKGRFRGRIQHLTGQAGLLEDYGGILCTVNVQSFAQVNPPAASLLYQEAARVAGSGARALELYAGSGVLSLHLSQRFEQVVAVEINRDAVRRGRADAARLGAANLTFQAEDAKVLSRYLPADLVALNPPRAGLSPEVLQGLLEARLERILYISCDPATWARDVGHLVRAGYRLILARPYDFYPFTPHVEVLSLLVLG